MLLNHFVGKQAYPERWRDWPCETLATNPLFTGRKVLIPICRNAERDKPEMDFYKKTLNKISSGFPEEIFFWGLLNNKVSRN